MISRRPYVLAAPALLVAVAMVWVMATDQGRYELGSVATDKIRAVTLDARHEVPPDVFVELASHGVDHVVLVPFGWQEGMEPTVKLNENARWFSEGDGGIARIAEQAAAQGIRVILKPHIWLMTGRWQAPGEGGTWRNDLSYDSETDWQIWEASYARFMLHYARLADRIDAPILCIGTELAGAVEARPEFWIGLIDSVRQVYSGKLTYSANWHEDYIEVPFWKELDYIGIQAYFPLTNAPKPSLDALLKGWKKHHNAIEKLQKSTDKPVLFTEVGYRSTSYAAERPWEWPSRSELETTEPDYPLQAALYDAFFTTFWSESWCAGSIIWKWYGDVGRSSARRAIDFTPQGKPAEEVMARWYLGVIDHDHDHDYDHERVQTGR